MNIEEFINFLKTKSVLKLKRDSYGNYKGTDIKGNIIRYQHMVDEDVIDATLAMAGQQTEIPKKPIETLKQAESLKIADVSLQLSKLSEENKTLKSDVETMKHQMDALMKAFSDDSKFGNLCSVNISERGIEIKTDAPEKHMPINNPFDVEGHIQKALKR